MSSRRLCGADLADIAVPETPALAPDGSWIAYVLRTNDLAADRTERGIWRIGVRTGSAHRLTNGPADTEPAWSPDGTRLAFLRAANGPAQVWLLPADGGEPWPLTDLPAGAGAPAWSPDGTRIAFTAPVPAEPGPIVTERLGYQTDGAEPAPPARLHLHVVDVVTGGCRRLTEGDWNAAWPAWSPDGTRLAFVADPGADADLVGRFGVHVVDATTGGVQPESVGSLAGAVGPIAWTTDGAAVLVIGRPDAAHGQCGLLRVPLGGGEIVDLAAPLDRNVLPGGRGHWHWGGPPRVLDDGRTVLFCARDGGGVRLYAVDVDGGAPRALLGGDGHVVCGLSAAGNTAVVGLVSPESFGEIAVVDVATGAHVVRTAHGAPLAGVDLFPRVARRFTISDGTTVSGWLTRDPAASGPGPLLLDIHGGPHGAWHGGADDVYLYHQELAALGWSVLVVNPRGSDGYGAEFFDGVHGAWGAADAPDLVEPVDALVAEGIADPARLAVTGYSYGGFMTCVLTARYDQFAAAVAGGPTTDLVSLTGTSDAGHRIAIGEIGAEPWRDPARYRELSPLAWVDRVRTPTLLAHGAADTVCPVGQSQQWHTALRERRVPTQLVIYPGAGHSLIHDGRPAQRLDYHRRLVDWVERYAGLGPRLDATHWRRRLDTLVAHHRVPGAALGILRVTPGRPDELVEAASGVLSAETGVPVTTDSLFQIGSISKMWTATLIMQLVDEGALDLDAPVVDILPELRLPDPEATSRVTARHLLTHTSGIAGDVFTDVGRGDDCLAKYVALLADEPPSHPLGAAYSYCNAGFTVLGRLIERLTGLNWDNALRERLVEPLGLAHTVTLPEDALLFRSAVGHLAGGERVTTSMLPRALGPAGLITSSVGDVLAFARPHLTGGRTADGYRLVTETSAAEMAQRQVDLPDPHTGMDSRGLGWARYDWHGRRAIGHDGGTIGQHAFLRLLPDAGLAVVLLTNRQSAGDLYEDLFHTIFAELADAELAHPPAPAAPPPTVDLGRHAGRYERVGARFDVFARDGVVALRSTVTRPLAGLAPDAAREYVLHPVDGDGDRFVLREPAARSWTPVTFYRLPGGERYLHLGGRAAPKVA